jgi:hypothetical protein
MLQVKFLILDEVLLLFYEAWARVVLHVGVLKSDGLPLEEISKFIHL